MKKVISVIVASMMMSMPIFAMADSADDAANTATEAPAVESTATVAPAATTAAGLPIFDETVTASETDYLAGGAALAFADDNFQLTTPGDWAQAELTEEQTAAGYIYSLNGGDGAAVMSVRSAKSEVATLDELLSTVTAIEGYTDVRAVLFGGVPYVAYTDAATSTFGYCALDAVRGGYLVFEFANGETAGDVAAQVMSSFALSDATKDCTLKTLEQLTAAPTEDGAEAPAEDGAEAPAEDGAETPAEDGAEAPAEDGAEAPAEDGAAE